MIRSRNSVLRSKYDFSKRGFSYVEVLLSAVIISLILVSAMRLFGNLNRSQSNNIIQANAVDLAMDMIEQIKPLDYRDETYPDQFGVETGEDAADRSSFDDIDDYNGWSSSPPKTRLGQDMTDYSSYTRSVIVEYVDPADFETAVGADQGFKKVTVIINREDKEWVRHEYIFPDARLR